MSLIEYFRRRVAGPSNLKNTGVRHHFAYHGLSAADWTGRDMVSLARHGVEQNPVAYRCIRMIAEAAASVPLRCVQDGETLVDHPIDALLQTPNPKQSGPAFLETVYGYLQTAGNSYIRAVTLDGSPRELYSLRPDRMRIRSDGRGWISAYEYSTGDRRELYPVDGDEKAPILHLKLFHPLSDHYGLAPLSVAGRAIDVQNAATSWNKALLDNSARPSGALVYAGPDGADHLTPEQFTRLKGELEDAYAGAANAGRPLLLEGGLDWRAMSLSPADMDFIEAKNNAAREIALAFGIPPMLLGIPGDNTYANYREANLAFWKQTVLPLVRKTAAALGGWLKPVFQSETGRFSLEPDSDAIAALSVEREARWRQIAQADFLDNDEKRKLLGLPMRKVNP